ncbi:MAG: GvpL/GvpF family gas vesicle protein, partial [Nanoarchaeota archaeon]
METEQKEIEEEKDEYIYVYGITNNKNIELGVKGLKNSPIKKINFKDISALTSKYPTLKPMLKEDEAMQHAAILKKIAEKTTIIPTSFGTVFKDQEILEIVLS